MDKFREEVKEALTPISNKGKILFAALICERLYPNYVFFQQTYNWGNTDVLKESLGIVYEYILTDDLITSQVIESAIMSIDSVTPNTEDFSGIFVSFALDACTSIYNCLNFLLDNNIENIVDVAVYARDTIDMFIQERDDLSTSDQDIKLKINNDPLMVKEKARQKELLIRLKNLRFDILTEQTIDSLRDKRPIINLEDLNQL